MPPNVRSWFPQRVMFVLPVRGGSGGANSVIQEAMGMRSLGVDAKVATHARYRDAFAHFYTQQLDSGDHFLFYGNEDELAELAAPFDVIVATLWSTPKLIAPISWQWPEKLYVYYIQDYEPWFFPDDPESRQIATDSYTLIPNMALMAKTDWICRTVRERHGRDVYRVAPSLDHDVYFPGSESHRADVPQVAAMIRPTTPRRGPVRTLRVLQEVAARTEIGFRVLLFGCEPRNLKTFLQRNAPDVELGENFQNRGILTRDGVADLLRDADIFVDLSDYQAFGRTGLEAMACGCAVILPDAGGVYEYAVHGHNTLLVDTRSMADMTQTILRLVQDQPMRASIAKNALETAAAFDIRRASLSELSTFRLAHATRKARRNLTRAEYRRGPTSVQVPAKAPTVAVLLPPPDNQAAADTLAQRILGPLRCKALRNRLAIHELLSVEELMAATACIAYRGTVSTQREADAVIARCQQSGVPLIYGTDVVPTIDDASDAVEVRLIEAADRIIVPTAETLAGADVLAESHVIVTVAAVDEQLWLEAGDATRLPVGRDEIRLLMFSDRNTDDLLAGVWSRVKKAVGRPVTLDRIGANGGAFDAANTIPRGSLPYDEFVRSMLAQGPWDIALLPADRETAAADLRFVSFAAMGLAIVCSSDGPHLQFAHDEVNAAIVDNREDAWAHCILELIGARSLRQRLGERAKRDVESEHTFNRNAVAFLQACTGQHQ